MKTILTILVVSGVLVAITLGVFIISAICALLIAALTELLNFAWGTGFHTLTAQEFDYYIGWVLKYWFQFSSILYIPAIIYGRMNYEKFD